MVEIALMIEGQDGLTWPRWMRLAQAAEENGFAGLYRSDHFTNAAPPDRDSLELWTSLTWLAANTRRIEFGPLVTPFSFRHPAHTARMAAAIDDLSGGRLVLGMGAGWQEREHQKYGFNLLDTDERFQRFEEGLQVVRNLLRSDQPFSFDGRFYQLDEVLLLPRPARPAGPPILIGGNGEKRTLPLVAQYADEWNAVYIAPPALQTLNRKLDTLITKAGRQPKDVRRSLMTGSVYGRDRTQVAERAARRSGGQHTPDELRQRGILVGTAAEIAAQVQEFSQAGAQRVMIQWLDQDDIEGIELLAREMTRNP